MVSPLVIAGPLLRRVEKDSVSVWLACKSDPIPQEDVLLDIELTLYESDSVKMTKATSPLTEFSKAPSGAQKVSLRMTKSVADPAAAAANPHITPTARMHRIGDRLYVAVVTAFPVVPLQPDKIYSYNIYIKDSNRPSINADFLSTGLLNESPAAEKRNQLPIGYKVGVLPTFCVPQDDVTKLVIAQASCRKAHGPGSDALGLLDKEIETNRTKPDKRPQQLFLTGDQVYADDVPGALLRYLHNLDGKPIVANDKMKVDPESAPLKIELRKFPPYMRQRLVHNHASMTSGSASCHILSFGEFCSLYLHYWNLRAWSQEFVDQIAKLKDGKDSTLDEVADTIFGPTTTVANAGVTAGDDNTIAGHIRAAIGNQTDRERLIDEESRDTFVSGDQAQLEKLTTWFEDRKRKMRGELKELYHFFEALPKVSRVLANVPSYMIFDDHEVTDDWYLNRRWKDQALSKPFGRDIIRNGLMAYCVFQDWGNRPGEYAVAAHPNINDSRLLSKPAELLKMTLRFCEQSRAAPDAVNFRRSFVDPIEKLVGLGDLDDTETVKWHYQVPSGPATTIVLDTRTRRSFSSPNAPAGLLDDAALKAQIPLANPSGGNAPFLIVVSAAPAPGLASFEELVQPLYAAFAGIGKSDGPDKGLAHGMIETDYEAWGFNTQSLEGLLERLARHKKVIILSGDVHYGFSSVLDYWNGTARAPKSRIATFTSSALKNEVHGLLHLYRSGLAHKILTGIGDQLEKVGWNDRVLSVTGAVSMRNRLRLRDNPAVIPLAGWMPGARVNRQPDFRWRLSVVSDEQQRPDALVTEDIVVDDELSMDAGYSNVVQQHQADFISGIRRRMVWPANVGLLTFEGTGDALKVKHDFLFKAESRSDKAKAGKHVQHEVVLVATDDDALRPEFP